MAIIIRTNKMVIDEEVVLERDSQKLYSFRMQLDNEDMSKISKIFETQAKNIKKENEEFEKEALENQEEFEKIVFKEHLEEMKKIATDYEINQLVDNVYFFILEVIAKNRLEKVNSMTSKLHNIGKR